MKSKKIALIICLVLSLFMIFILASCGNDEESTDGLILEERNGTYVVTGYLGTANEVVIPNSYKCKNVTSIGDWAFYSCTCLTSITIPKAL